MRDNIRELTSEERMVWRAKVGEISEEMIEIYAGLPVYALQGEDRVVWIDVDNNEFGYIDNKKGEDAEMEKKEINEEVEKNLRTNELLAKEEEIKRFLSEYLSKRKTTNKLYIIKEYNTKDNKRENVFLIGSKATIVNKLFKIMTDNSDYELDIKTCPEKAFGYMATFKRDLPFFCSNTKTFYINSIKSLL